MLPPSLACAVILVYLAWALEAQLVSVLWHLHLMPNSSRSSLQSWSAQLRVELKGILTILRCNRSTALAWMLPPTQAFLSTEDAAGGGAGGADAGAGRGGQYQGGAGVAVPAGVADLPGLPSRSGLPLNQRMRLPLKLQAYCAQPLQLTTRRCSLCSLIYRSAVCKQAFAEHAGH